MPMLVRQVTLCKLLQHYEPLVPLILYITKHRAGSVDAITTFLSTTRLVTSTPWCTGSMTFAKGSYENFEIALNLYENLWLSCLVRKAKDATLLCNSKRVWRIVNCNPPNLGMSMSLFCIIITLKDSLGQHSVFHSYWAICLVLILGGGGVSNDPSRSGCRGREWQTVLLLSDASCQDAVSHLNGFRDLK